MKEYDLIKEWYAGKTSERGQQPYIKHIDEGLEILSEISASENAMRAWCIHPLVQMNDDLAYNCHTISELDGPVIMLAMEYRNIANAYLSHRNINSIEEIALSPLPEVNQMLVADKVQNSRDFLQYSRFTMTTNDTQRLVQYFINWLERLKGYECASLLTQHTALYWMKTGLSLTGHPS